MRVVEIACENFISYEQLDLDLREVSMGAIVGKNGNGKSSLFEMIRFGLWGQTRKDSVLAEYIRDGADEATVRVVFEARGDEYTVTRTMYANGRGNTVSLTRDGKDVLDPKENQAKHTVKDIQSEIDRLVGLDYDAAEAGPLMMQGDSGNLMKRGPSKAKDLLIKLFGVDRYEQWHEKAKTEATAYAREAEVYAGEVDALDRVIADEAQADLALATAQVELQEAVADREKREQDLQTLREKQVAQREQARHAATLRQTVDQLKLRIASDKEEYDRQLRGISQAHQQKDEPEPTFPELEVVSEDAIKVMEGEWKGLSEQAARRAVLRSQIPVLAKDLTEMRERASIVDTVPCHGEGIYAACRFLTSAPTQDDIEKVRVNGASMKAEYDTLATTEAADAAYAKLDAARKASSVAERELVRREAAISQWRLKVETAKQTAANGSASLDRLTTQIERDQQRLDRAVSQLSENDVDALDMDEAEAEVRALTDAIEEAKRSIVMLYEPAVRRADEQVRRIKDAKVKRPDVERKSREADAKSKTYSVLAKAFHRNGIPTLIIENSIPLIEEQANEVLSRMPDNYAIRLRTQRERKGGMMDKLHMVIETPEGTERSYVMLSAGEQFRVDFALRIAISRVVANRVGGAFSTLMVDEGFGSQDEEGISAMLESLAAVQEDFALVLVISHQQAIIERFQSQLRVSRDEGGSRVDLAA